jgi:probable O-glycosylation ligase (exosortase A-associated)
MRDALLLFVLSGCLLVALRYPFVALIAWAWFVIMNPHQMAYGVYGIPLNTVIAGVAIVAFIMHDEVKRFRFDRITILLLVFAAWLGISQLFSLDPKNSGIYVDRFIKTLAFVVLCAMATTDKLRFHALVWMLVIGVGYFALKGALFTIVTLGEYRVQGLPNTVMEDNNHTGIIIATILPLILYLRGEATNKLVRFGLLALFVAAILAIVGTHSRGAFVALAAFAGFFWLRSKRKLTILAALALVMIPAIAFMPAKWTERMTTIAEATQDASFMGRVDAWVINTKLALEHPLTGAGLRNSYQKPIAASVDPKRAESAKAAHSIYFEVLGGSGFVGLAIYLALLATAFFVALSFHLKRNDPAIDPWVGRFGYFATMALVVFGVGGATVSIEMWDGYLLIIALIAALSKLAQASVTERETLWKHVGRFRWRVAARGRGVRSARPTAKST